MCIAVLKRIIYVAEERIFPIWIIIYNFLQLHIIDQYTVGMIKGIQCSTVPAKYWIEILFPHLWNKFILLT